MFIDIYNLYQTIESVFTKFSTRFVNLKIFEDVNFVHTALITYTHHVKINSSILRQTTKYYKTYFNFTKKEVHITLIYAVYWP